MKLESAAVIVMDAVMISGKLLIRNIKNRNKPIIHKLH